MLTASNRHFYKNWLVIGLLLGLIYVFGHLEAVNAESAAAPCIQECESNQNECNDNCDPDCRDGSTSAVCSSCLQTCSQAYFQCLSYAISCDNLDTVPGHCAVGFGLHCVPYSGGYSCSTQQGAYYGYYMICHNVGGAECVSCTEGYCYGVNPDIPGCFAGFYP